MAIALSDLAPLTEAERQAHARAMRKRLRELHDELGVRVPVYVLFTKADLVAGFVEFFDSLGREEREQVWGMTLPLDVAKGKDGAVQEGSTQAGAFGDGSIGDGAGAVAKVGAGFDGLLARLNDRMLERVHQETDVQRRRLIYGFPQQIAAMRELATEFLTEIFRPSRLETPPLLRGVYFTSGTQDGTPIDRLLGVMAGRFGLRRQAVPAFSGAGRSYFLTRLLREVVFGEAGLVATDPKVERRARWTWRAAYGIAAAVLVLATAGWTRSYLGNRDMIAEVHGTAGRYDAQYAELVKRGPGDTDLRAILPPLATLRTIRGGYEQREAATPIALTFGLYQGNKLSEAAIEGYYRALNALLLPRLLARIETQLRANLSRPDFLYEALKVYLVLGRQGPIDHDQVMAWLITDLNASMPSDDDTPDRDALLAHADAMLQRPLTAVPLDGPLIAQVRDILNREPLAEYSYNRIMRSPRIQALPEWTVADNGGPGSGKVFQLRSGKPVTTGLPGIFTWAGYHNAFLPLLPLVTKDIAEDGWVLGRDRRGGVTGALAEVNKLRRDVIGLYLDEYVRRWDVLLGDVVLKPFGTITDGVDVLGLLSGPSSPLRNLLTAVDAQTQLSRPAASDAATQKAEAKALQVGQRTAGFASYIGRNGMTVTQNQIADILGEAIGSTPGSAPVDPASRVDDHFKPLHAFVAGAKDQPAPMEAALQKIGTVYAAFTQAANAPNPGQVMVGQLAGGANGGGGGAAAAGQQLGELAKDMPKPVAAMMQTVAQSSSSVAAGGASRELSNAWRSKVLPLCQAAFDRYPFVAGSSSDVGIDDFARLLGPGGMIDQFFNDNLKSFVDTTTRPWHWQAANQAQLGLSQATLTQFERAALIRDSLFGAGGTALQVRFQLVPVSLDAGVGKVTLEIGGQAMTYDHGPPQSAWFQWPGPGGKTLVRETMTPAAGNAGGGGEFGADKDGAWALLRFLDTVQVIPSGQPDKFRMVLRSPAGNATFELNASSVRNPFTLSALRSFRCPASL